MKSRQSALSEWVESIGPIVVYDFTPDCYYVEVTQETLRLPQRIAREVLRP